MVKKLFALASVTALGGLVAAVSAAGCTSTEVVQQTGDSGATDGGKKDARPQTPGDDEESEEPNCKAKITFTPDDINPPRAASATACTQATIDAIADACLKDFNDAACTAARELAANKTCAECLFSDKTDAEWGAVVLEQGGQPRLNQAGCIEHVTGVKGCGEAYLTIIACVGDFCEKCPENEVSGCVTEVLEGEECGNYRISDQKCGAALQAKEDAVDACFLQERSDAAYKALFNHVATTFCASKSAGGDPDGG